MRRMQLSFLPLFIAVFAFSVGCDSTPATTALDSNPQNSTPSDETASPTSDNPESNTEAPATASPTQSDATDKAADDDAAPEPATKPTTVATILFNECSAPENLKGWHLVNKLGCQCAWPVDREFSEFALYSGRGEEPVFSFGAEPRNEDFTIDQILSATKKATTTSMGMRVTESKELNVGDRIRCLAYAAEDRSNRQLFRIYITELQVWVISASYPKENDLHPSLNYFFKNFKITDVLEYDSDA